MLCAGTVSDGETMHVISVSARCGRGGLMTSKAGILITVPVSLLTAPCLRVYFLFVSSYKNLFRCFILNKKIFRANQLAKNTTECNFNF